MVKEKTPSIAKTLTEYVQQLDEYKHIGKVFGFDTARPQGDLPDMQAGLVVGTVSSYDPNAKTVTITDIKTSIEEMKEIFKQQWTDILVRRYEDIMFYGPKPGSMITAAPENETKAEYDARMKAKAERRVANDLTNLANKKKEDNADKHWTDKLNKPWYGAVGSLYMLRI